jgi:hypothetical protein
MFLAFAVMPFSHNALLVGGKLPRTRCGTNATVIAVETSLTLAESVAFRRHVPRFPPAILAR